MGKQELTFSIENLKTFKNFEDKLVEENYDKQLIASIILWDYENKQIIYEINEIYKAVTLLEFSQDDKFLCAALHIGSDIFAVGAGIGQKPFFIKGLRIVKGLFRRKPIQTVCFPLQGGEVKQFRRGCGLFLFFKGSTNGLRFLASRFHLPRRRFVVLPFGKGGNAANVQPDDMIFLFLKAADCIVAVYQHSKGGRLHSADIQCFMVEDREKAGRVNANEPIGLCSAKRGLIEVVIAAPVFEI